MLSAPPAPGRGWHPQGTLWSECPQHDLAAELLEQRLRLNELVLVCSLMMWSGAIARQLRSVVPGSNEGTERLRDAGGCWGCHVWGTGWGCTEAPTWEHQ